MRRAFILLGFVAAVFILGAALSPAVYFCASALGQAVPAMKPLASNPFPRFVSRTMLVLAIAGAWPLVRMLGASLAEAGVTRPQWRMVMRSAALALVALGTVVLMAIAFDARSWRNPSALAVSRSAAMAAGAAMVIAPLEEVIFRGMLFGLMRQRNRWWPALLVSSTIFAAVHFLHTAAHAGPVLWDSGFDVLRAMATPAENAGAASRQFLNLLLCGAILALAYQRTGTLWFSIGLHAGWIFWLKFANSVTVTTGLHPAFWGTRKLIDGWSATAALALTALTVPLLTRAKRPKHFEPDDSPIVADMG